MVWDGRQSTSPEEIEIELARYQDAGKQFRYAEHERKKEKWKKQ